MSVVVLGASGQLARHLLRVLPEADCWGRAHVDAGDAAALTAALLDARPAAIIMAAAYTAVDRAEEEREVAWRLNAEAPAAAARVAAGLDVPLLHVSSDYVFDGESDQPYGVNAPTRPLSVYGASKLAGELAVRTLCPRHWILRTSWVFSEHGANFVKTVLRLASGPGPLRIVADQWGTPTYAGHLAALVAAMNVTADTAKLPYGTYHFTSGPSVSWHRFAERIVEEATKMGMIPAGVRVEPISTAAYPTAARRPARSVLAPSPEIAALGLDDFDWRLGLRTVLAALATTSAGKEAGNA